MKRFMSKKSIQKIMILIVIVLSFNFVMPTYSRADFGGVLFDPLVDLVAGIGDAVLAALQYFMYDGGASLNGQNVFSLSVPNKAFSPQDFGVSASEGEINTKVSEEYLAELGWWTSAINWIEDAWNWFWGNTKSDFEEATEDSPYGIPVVRYSPEEIFSNNVPALDANFITPKQWGVAEQNERSVTQIIHDTIASWYVTLRNLAIIALLSVLLYVGIRIVISSTAADKAKYKQMLMDWLVALCILFFLHYVMTFILTLTETITDGIANSTEDIVVGIYDENGSIVKNYWDEELIYKTDLTGLCRLKVQSRDLTEKLVYLIMYIALVIYTVMFTWTYVKRAIIMAFLTLVAPLISITYPIDKISDGKAQAFNIWLREFIFNALLQPFHLLIYTIFLGSSIEIATENPIFAILFLAFISPAEKLLRKMFGFDKSETTGGLNTAAGLLGGAAVLKTAGNLAGKIGKNSKGNTGGGKAGRGVRTKNTGNNTSSSESTSVTSAFGKAGNKGRQSQQTKKRNKTWTENDQRGITGWAFDNLKEAVGNSPIGKAGRAIKNSKFVRTIGSGARKVRNLPRIVPKPIRNSIRRAVGTVGTAGRLAGRAAVGTLKFAGKTAVTGIGAGLGATVGLAAGITGDDLEDVMKLGATGAGIGAAGVSAGASAMIRAVPETGRNIRNLYEETTYGANGAALRQQTRELMKDKSYEEEIKKSLEKKYEELGKEGKPSSREIKVAMRAGTEYANAGIPDIKVISKAVALEDKYRIELEQEGITGQEGVQKARERSIAVAKIANGLQPKDIRDEKTMNGVRNALKDQLMSKGNLSEEEANKQSEKVLQNVKEVRGSF